VHINIVEYQNAAASSFVVGPPSQKNCRPPGALPYFQSSRKATAEEQLAPILRYAVTWFEEI